MKGSDPMSAWISANLINIVLTAAIVLIVGLLIFVTVRDKRAGKSSCGGSCGSCSACGGCHMEKRASPENR